MRKKCVLSSKEAALLSVQNLGGKANHLSFLTANQYPVPQWHVLPTWVYDGFLSDSSLQSLLKKRLESLIECQNATTSVKENQLIKEASLDIQALIMKTPWPTALHNLCQKEISQLILSSNNCGFAVRSSVVGEDGGKFSFAGQMDSFLFQQKPDEILDSIKKCYASAFSERALQYRLKNKLSSDTIKTAVIIQKMVVGQISGVMFTANPVSGSRKEVLISAGWGLCDGVVTGQTDCDEYTVETAPAESYETCKIKKQVTSKNKNVGSCSKRFRSPRCTT